MFFKQAKNGKITVLIALLQIFFNIGKIREYGLVDDIILTSDDMIEMENSKRLLPKEFEIYKLGALRYTYFPQILSWNWGS